MGARESQFRRGGVRVFGSLMAVSVIAGFTLVITAGGSGAAPESRGSQCSSRHAAQAGRGFTCADLSVVLTHQPARVEIGRPFTAKLAVHNFGPNFASNVTASDTLPTSMTFVSSTSSQGSCTGPPVGQTGQVNCTIGGMNPGATVNITVRMRPTMSGMQNNQAATSSPTFDPFGPNNSDSEQIDVQTNTRGCTIVGTNNADDMTGTSEADVICGLQGPDHIDGGMGPDTIYGQRGGDTLTDHNGTDDLNGGPGGDTLDTADGAAGDVVNGNDGVNTCTTDAGDTALHCA